MPTMPVVRYRSTVPGTPNSGAATVLVPAPAAKAAAANAETHCAGACTKRSNDVLPLSTAKG